MKLSSISSILLKYSSLSLILLGSMPDPFHLSSGSYHKLIVRPAGSMALGLPQNPPPAPPPPPPSASRASPKSTIRKTSNSGSVKANNILQGIGGKSDLLASIKTFNLKSLKQTVKVNGDVNVVNGDVKNVNVVNGNGNGNGNVNGNLKNFNGNLKNFNLKGNTNENILDSPEFRSKLASFRKATSGSSSSSENSKSSWDDALPTPPKPQKIASKTDFQPVIHNFGQTKPNTATQMFVKPEANNQLPKNVVSNEIKASPAPIEKPINKVVEVVKSNIDSQNPIPQVATNPTLNVHKSQSITDTKPQRTLKRKAEGNNDINPSQKNAKTQDSKKLVNLEKNYDFKKSSGMGATGTILAGGALLGAAGYAAGQSDYNNNDDVFIRQQPTVVF